MQSDAGRLVDEERERVVERRQLGSDLAELLERERAHPARRGTVTHLLEAVGVREHERPPLEVEDVELDQVDAHLDGRPERAKGVLGSERRRAAMTDAQHAAGRAVQVDHDATAGAGLTGADPADPPPGREADHDRLGDDDRGRQLRRVLPERLRVDTQQRVGVREAPGVAAEEDLVEAQEEPVEAEQDHRHGKRCDAERERRSRAAAPTGRRSASAASDGARSRGRG